jgi:hypothetical protein
VASDLKSAKECWQEHTTIRKVALHVLDDTGGLLSRRDYTANAGIYLLTAAAHVRGRAQGRKWNDEK